MLIDLHATKRSDRFKNITHYFPPNSAATHPFLYIHSIYKVMATFWKPMISTQTQVIFLLLKIKRKSHFLSLNVQCTPNIPVPESLSNWKLLYKSTKKNISKTKNICNQLMVIMEHGSTFEMIFFN